MMKVGVLLFLFVTTCGCDRGAGASKGAGASLAKNDTDPALESARAIDDAPDSNDPGDGHQQRELKNYFALKAVHRAVEKATNQIDCPSMKAAFVGLNTLQVTDAYGVEMRAACREGDLEVRSSGPDRVFGNEDDDVMMNKESKVRVIH